VIRRAGVLHGLLTASRGVTARYRDVRLKPSENSTRSEPARSSFSRPPSRWWITRGNLPLPQGHQVAPLVRIASHLRAVLTAHVPLKLVDRCCLRSADYIERNGPVRVASEAAHRSTRHPTSAKVAQVHGSRACACSMLHTRAYRLPCGLPGHTPLLRERTRRKSTGGTWWSSDMIAPNGDTGKPLGFGRPVQRPTVRGAPALVPQDFCSMSCANGPYERSGTSAVDRGANA
jgi:hypothetical protein